MSSSRSESNSFPWYLRALIGVAVLVILFVIAVDLLHMLNAL